MPSELRRRIPKSSRTSMIRSYAGMTEVIIDWSRRIRGKREEMIPSRHVFMRSGIGGRYLNFERDGSMVVQSIVEIAELKPYERVLEIGCGVGRNAVPLTAYMSRDGVYEGLDISRGSVGWCQQKITTRHPNFRFQLADVYNARYNPTGSSKGSDYKLPYPDNHFDFIFAVGVFQHIMPNDLEKYFVEIERTLRAGSRCLLDFWLLNPESTKLVDSRSDFKYQIGPGRYFDKDIPEAGIAYQESFIRDVYRKSGLTVEDPIHFGSWPGRPFVLMAHDSILATKNS